MRTTSSLAGWRTSRHSGSSANCVEVATGGRIVGVRDTKQHGFGPVLTFTGPTWRTFIAAAKAGALGR
jgi:Domain of unknown function (DUF397)